MKILSLNCQRGMQATLKDFLQGVLEAKTYDLLLLQEVNDEVFTFLNHPAYKLIRPFNEETGQNSQLCIVYRARYEISGTGFKSLASMYRDPIFKYGHPCFSLMWIDLKMAHSNIFRFATLHLHSGINRHVRIAEIKVAKKNSTR